MSALRVLLIEENGLEADRIVSLLEEANHAVLPAQGFAEASEALKAEKFDAVLVGSAAESGLPEFTMTLRQMERKQRNPGRTAVLSFNHSEAVERPPAESAIDGYLPREFEAATFVEAVRNLARALSSNANLIADLPVFEQEEFEAQVAHDRELMVEIIDLFLADRADQIQEMRNSLAAGDYQRLCRAAHSMKGALGSIHAPQARAHAQQLELAAKEREDQICRFSLAALEQDLDTLEPCLLALRSTAAT